MGIFKITFIVCFTVLSFHARKSQTKSVHSDESEREITGTGNIEDSSSKECIFFPKLDSGFLVSQYFPPDDDQRLVVYLYKRKLSDQLTAYIPSWKKQTLFPDLTFDSGDKFESIASEGISNLFNSEHFTKPLDGVDINADGKPSTTVNLTNIPNLDISSVPISADKPEIENAPSSANPVSSVHILPDELNEPNTQAYPNQQENNIETWHPINSVDSPPYELTIPSNTYESVQENDNRATYGLNPIILDVGLPDEIPAPTRKNQGENGNGVLQNLDLITLVKGLPGEIKIPSSTYKNSQENDYGATQGFNPMPLDEDFLDENNLPSNTYKSEQENNNSVLQGLDQISPEKSSPDEIKIPDNIRKNIQATDNDGLNQNSLVKGPPDEITISTNTYENSQENDNTHGINLITLGEGHPNQINIPTNTYKSIQENDNRPFQGMNPTSLEKGPQDGINVSDQVGIPGADSKNIELTSLHNSIPLPDKNQQQNLNFQSGQHSMNDRALIDTNESNMPIKVLPSLGGLVEHIPGFTGLLTPFKTQETGWMTAPSRSSNIINVKHLPNEYDHPTFNGWFNNQIISLLSTRPFMSNTINFHALRLRLVKALHDNGIHLSRDGDLYDSNGNMLRMANLKLRPFLLGDPMEYEKVIATKKCIIPYDIPYLEAILLTLVYPPRILAIIPLSLRNYVYSSSKGSSIPKLCGKSTCHSHEESRSGFPEKGESTNDLNDKKLSQENNGFIYKSTDISGELAGDSSNIEDKHNYPYNKPAYSELPIEESSTPKNHLEFSENIEPQSHWKDDNAEVLNEENYETLHEKSGMSDKNIESTNPNDPNTKDFNMNVSPGDQGKDGGEIVFLDKENNMEETKSLVDFDVPQKPADISEDDDNEMLTIRIVGGNPATSSGTPVSSKGRSGWGP